MVRLSVEWVGGWAAERIAVAPADTGRGRVLDGLAARRQRRSRPKRFEHSSRRAAKVRDPRSGFGGSCRPPSSHCWWVSSSASLAGSIRSTSRSSGVGLTVMRPYMRAQVRPYVLTRSEERVVQAGRFFKECAQGLPGNDRRPGRGVHDGIAVD